MVVAAGKGLRFKGDIPKQYCMVLNQPLLFWSLQPFLREEKITSIHLALAPDDRHISTQAPWLNSVHCHFCGGQTRAETVKNALEAIVECGASAKDWVLIHDAARPCLSQEALSRLLQHQKLPGALLALPVRDTLKRVSEKGEILETVPRTGLWQAQTPQLFPIALLKEALSQQGPAFTDEASAIEALGLKPFVVLGDVRNIKVTYPEDIPMVETLLKGMCK